MSDDPGLRIIKESCICHEPKAEKAQSCALLLRRAFCPHSGSLPVLKSPEPCTELAEPLSGTDSGLTKPW